MRTFLALVVLSMTAIMAAPAAQQICESGTCAGSTCLVNPVQLESDYLLASNTALISNQANTAIQEISAMPFAAQTCNLNGGCRPCAMTQVATYTSATPTSSYSYSPDCNSQISYSVNSCGQPAACGTVCNSQPRRVLRRNGGLVRRIFSRRSCAQPCVQSCGQMTYVQTACAQPCAPTTCAQPCAQTACAQPRVIRRVLSRRACAPANCGQSCCSQTNGCQTQYGQAVVYGQAMTTETPVQPVPDAEATQTNTPNDATPVPDDGEGINLPEIPPAKELSDPVDDGFAAAVQRPRMVQTSYVSTIGSAPGIAQQKANSAARMGLRGHVGGSLGGAKYEGVGWSNVSAQHAVQQCCYWGKRTPVQIGVAQGTDGFYYACVLYR